MARILVLNGPNLNMLGQREPEIYGRETLSDIETLCRQKAGPMGLSIDFRQSNHEGELITWIQQEKDNIAGLIINAGGYTHTSVAIHDALRLLRAPVVEVHLSNPKEREAFRHFSYIEPVAARVFAGFGAQSYIKALDFLAERLAGA